MQVQLAGLSADRIMDTLVGVSDWAKGMTATEIDDLFAAAAVACREDEQFMALLRKLVDGPTAHALEPQAIDLATILKIIAAIKTIIDLFGQLRGGGSGLIPGTPQGYVPNQQNRCL